MYSIPFMLGNLGLGRIMSTAADCDMKLIKSSPSGSSNVPLEYQWVQYAMLGDAIDTHNAVD